MDHGNLLKYASEFKLSLLHIPGQNYYIIVRSINRKISLSKIGTEQKYPPIYKIFSIPRAVTRTGFLGAVFLVRGVIGLSVNVHFAAEC